MADREEQQLDGSNGEDAVKSKGVEAVTDYVEEKANAADALRTQAALSSLSASSSSSATTTYQGTDSAPAPVVIKEEDWKLLVEECEITKDVAESWLKANGGDITKTLQAYIHGTLPTR